MNWARSKLSRVALAMRPSGVKVRKYIRAVAIDGPGEDQVIDLRPEA